MDIRKLNNNCITCRISKQELADRGVVLEDLLSDKEKARELLSEVLIQAEQVVDFKADGGSLNVQMTVLADGDINLTIFDDDKSAFAAMLKQYKELLEAKRQELMELVDKDSGKEPAPTPIEVGNPISALSAKETRDLLNSKDDDEPVDLPVAVSFTSLDDLMGLSKLLFAWNGDTESSLYSYNGRYYLQLVLTETKATLVRSIFALSEYSGTIENNIGNAIKITEHGRCIMEKHALKNLASLADE